MYWPFVVFALPRSRTAWMQAWLGGPRLVGHDTAIAAPTVQAWLDGLWHGRSGTVETGAEGLARLAALAMPGGRQLVVRRPVAEVVDSLRRVGLADSAPNHSIYHELERRDGVLSALAASGVESIRYSDLADVSCCAWVFEYLTGLRFDFDWWQLVSGQNIQINVAESLAEQLAGAARMAGLKAEAEDAEAALASGALPRYLRLGVEPWESFWPDIAAKAASHHSDTHRGEAYEGRAFDLDEAGFAGLAASGQLLICSARLNGRVVGYCLWVLGKALQARGTLVARQGPLYVEPGNYGIAHKLLYWAREHLPSLGYREIEFQANVHGRSPGLGRALERLGARPVKTIYSLSVEAQPNA